MKQPIPPLSIRIKPDPLNVSPLVVRDKQGRDLVRFDANLEVHYTSEADLVEAIKIIVREYVGLSA